MFGAPTMLSRSGQSLNGNRALQLRYRFPFATFRALNAAGSVKRLHGSYLQRWVLRLERIERIQDP